MTILKNYQEDLLKSRITPLLIELSKKDLNAFGDDGYKLALVTAKELYDIPLKNTSETNLIYIDANNAKNFEHIYLFEEFLNLITDQVEASQNLAIAKETISAGLSFAMGGLLNDTVGSLIDKGFELVADNISSELTDSVVDFTLENIDISDKFLGTIEDKSFEYINDKTVNFLDKIKDKKLYLSSNSKEAIKDLSKEFKKNLTPAESFRLVLQLMLSVAIDMPTMLFIKDPHKLDRDSLAILSLLFSYSRDIKDKNKHTGLSVVYAYEDEAFQPYKQVDQMYQVSKRLLDEQRLYMQRYAMLERPTSDIPNIAVKTSMFVGRTDELTNLRSRYNYSKGHQNTATLETISGEPGIGKTKLVKEHLEQIKKIEPNGSKQVQLTLLNQVGHTSTNTGLSSLTDSIIKESGRLETLKTFREKVLDNTTDYIYNSVTNIIKNTLGVDAVINIASAVSDKVFLDGQIDKTKLNTVGDLDNKPQDKKQIQFKNLTIAIKKLRELSNESSPIVLFIDDLQWIDEDSAEYLLKHFIRQFNVHIVATIRPSDATTVLKKAYENHIHNPYKVALLKKAGIKLEEEIVSDINTTTLEFNVTHLLGLDFITLKSLISQVIQGDEQYQEILASAIIKELNNDKTKDEVNTLFAVETINMLCDKKLYSSQEEDNTIDQLILTDIPIRFNTELNNFHDSLENTFKVLNKKYEKSLSHYHDTTDESRKFNLMAYAVLEERLNILEIYFRDHGNAAVNTLLFSSWLGTLFNSTVVKDILEALAETDDRLLTSLKNYINKGKECITLSIYHYEIIEEVYEILSRYLDIRNSYSHRHSLLSIFLDNQLEYLVKTLFMNNSPSINRTYSFVMDKIISYDEESLNIEHAINFVYNIAYKALKNNRKFDNMEEIYGWYIKTYSVLYDSKKLKSLEHNLPIIVEHVENEYHDKLSKEWREKYFDILWKAVSLSDRLFNKNAITYINKMYPIINIIPNTDEGNKLKGEFYYKTGGYKYLHVNFKEGLQELLLSVRYLKYIANNSDAQATLSYAYGRIGELLQRDAENLIGLKKGTRLTKALSYHKNSLDIINHLILSFPENLTFLTKSAVVYERIGQTYRSLNEYDKALVNFREAERLKEKYFSKSNQSFGFRKILIVLSDFYREINMPSEAKQAIEKAMTLTNEIEMKKYIQNKDQYQLESYIKIYEKYCEFNPNSLLKKKLYQLQEASVNRGLTMEY